MFVTYNEICANRAIYRRHDETWIDLM